jgi:hypothetical protein
MIYLWNLHSLDFESLYLYANVKDHYNNVKDHDVLLQWDESVKRFVLPLNLENLSTIKRHSLAISYIFSVDQGQ